MNTSVTAVLKNGEEQVFNSIEEAAEALNLSVRTIKGRANKPGSSGKDKITFRWNDEHTRKSLQAKRSRQKGNSYELEVINQLKSIGYDGCVSSRSESKRTDDMKIDIVDTKSELQCYVQCKALASQPNYWKIRNECPKDDKPYVIFWKKQFNDGTRSPESIVMLPASYFYELIKK